MTATFRKIGIAIIFSVVFYPAEIFAQVNVKANGLGRGVLTNNKLSGNVLENDTASRRKGLSGYNLFDLSLGMDKGREFQANVIMRIRQPYGQFWGEETNFEFRQLQVMGDLKRISYAVGDVDVEMTPYTVFNAHELYPYHGFEADMFRARRDIAHYENFYKGNVWRLQGVRLGSQIYFGDTKILEYIEVKGFGVRTNVTDDFSIPDRVLTGISAHAVNSEKLKAGVNYAGYLDIPLDDFTTNYQNNVITGDFDIRVLKSDKLGLYLFGEGGISDYDHYRLKEDSTATANDFFVDGGVKAVLKNGMKFGVSYKNVGVKFSSPAAQTRRVNESTAPLLFSNIYNNTTSRNQLLYDRFTQESIYNRGISPVLQPFIPYFNNSAPYGAATPNRTGFTLDFSSGDTSRISFGGKAMYLTEVVGEGSPEKRNFISASAGTRIGVGKLIGFKKDLDVILGGRMEKTDRGDGAVDLTGMILDAGLTVELFESFDLMGGFKYLSADGKEVIAIRNDINNITGYTGFNVELTQSILAFGFRLNFNETTNLLVNYNLVSQEDKLDETLNYNIDQLFINFNIMF